MKFSQERKRELNIRIDYNNMMKKYVGEYGISDAELSALSGKAAKRIKLWRRKEQTEAWTGETFRIIKKKW